MCFAARLYSWPVRWLCAECKVVFALTYDTWLGKDMFNRPVVGIIGKHLNVKQVRACVWRAPIAILTLLTMFSLLFALSQLEPDRLLLYAVAFLDDCQQRLCHCVLPLRH